MSGDHASDVQPDHAGYGVAPADGAEVWTVVVAAGRGARFGADKQVADLDGRTVLARSVAVAGTVGGVVVVVAGDRTKQVATAFADDSTVVAVVAGGASRSASVRAGLAVVPEAADMILVHDGARPLASPALFRSVVEAVGAGADAVVPGVPVADSLRRMTGGPVDRSGVVAVQTPQGFPAGLLRGAHRGEADASDDASLVEAAGGTVVVVDGERTNLKITTPADLDVARRILAEWGDDG